MSNVFLKCIDLHKHYVQASEDSIEGNSKLEVLKNINLEVRSGEQIAIVGSSGSGKTTLLNSLSGLDSPTSGEVLINKVAGTLQKAS